jgi:NADH-quinone oxidoreductase subunit E
LITTSCLGLCGVGPVITIDEDVIGNVTPDQISDILARYL